MMPCFGVSLFGLNYFAGQNVDEVGLLRQGPGVCLLLSM